MAKIGLILTILLTMIMSPVLEQKRIVEKGIVYELCVWKKDGLQATVIGDTKDMSADVVIPATVSVNDTAYIVTAIETSAFEDSDTLTSIFIPESITEIGAWAFNCKNLKSIKVAVGNPNFSVYNGVLYNKAKTKIIFCPKNIKGAFVIPKGVTEIGVGAFAGCKGLTSIIIPAGVKSIEQTAFSCCESLVSVTIPGSVEDFGRGVFSSCSNLKSVKISNGVKYIAPGMFDLCSSLASITIPKSVRYIGEYAFASCQSLKTITLPQNVTTIHDMAFSNCHNLTSINIPDSVTSINNAAFHNCTGLTSFTIPESVTYMGKNVFLRSCNIADIYCYADLHTLKWPRSFTDFCTTTKLHILESCKDVLPAAAQNDFVTLITDASMITVVPHSYTGKPQKPQIVYNDKTLTEGEDYELKLPQGGCIQKGNYKITISFIKLYRGKFEKTFSIQ